MIPLLYGNGYFVFVFANCVENDTLFCAWRLPVAVASL
jgi:hypothetical protein